MLVCSCQSSTQPLLFECDVTWTRAVRGLSFQRIDSRLQHRFQNNQLDPHYESMATKGNGRSQCYMLAVRADSVQKDHLTFLVGLVKHFRNVSAEDTVTGWLTNVTVQSCSEGIRSSSESYNAGMVVGGRIFMQGAPPYTLTCEADFIEIATLDFHTCASSCIDSAASLAYL
jgi:hypothetical protein